MNSVKHVAIIMDGNGRWGIKHKNSRNAGHREGLNTVEMIIKESLKLKQDYAKSRVFQIFFFGFTEYQIENKLKY